MGWRDEIRRAFDRERRRVDEDVVEEMTQHAEAEWQKRRAEGDLAGAADAHVRALIDSWARGTAGPRLVRREPLLASAPASTSRWAGLGLDVRHAFRLLRRQPGFVAVSIAMIALGIASMSVVFSVVNGVLLQPLPWPNASRLVRVSETREGGTVAPGRFLTNATFLAWQRAATTIDGLGGWSPQTVTLEEGGGAERIDAARVTAGLFPVLGVKPFIGSAFTDANDTDSVAVLSYGFWRERFAAAPDIVGRTLRLSSEPVTVIGVMPEGFAFPAPNVRVWLPSRPPNPSGPDNSHTVSMFDAVALLKPGASAEQAAADGQASARSLPDLGPVIPAVFGSSGPALVQAKPVVDWLVGDVRPALWTLLVAVTLLWLAAVGNVASLQLAHAVARRREVAIRTAIGAGTARLVRQLIVENLMLGIAGGLTGLALTMAVLKVVPSLLPADFPRVEMVQLDARVLMVAAAMAITTSIIIALLPARQAAAIDLRSTMAEDATFRRRARFGARPLIAAGQVAIAAALLTSGALLTRSFINTWRLDRGFDRANVMTARVQFPPSIAAGAARTAAVDALIARLSADSRVRAVGSSDGIPLGGGERRFASMIVRPNEAPRTISAVLRDVTPGYFAAIGLRLAEGRTFEPTDTHQRERVMVVNRTFAKQYLGEQPVGVVVPLGINSGETTENWRVIGVVDDAQRADTTDPPAPEIFVSLAQLDKGPVATNYFVLRTTGDPNQIVPDIRAAVRAVHPLATVDQTISMEARLMRSLARPRLYAVLFGGFAVIAALVALVGLFGGLSYGVTQRTREISLRTALGATPATIVWLVVSEGAVLTAAGVATGILAASAGASALGQYLFGITTRDPLTYAVVAAVVLTAGLAASALPARRAAGIDPLKGLRS